ncbi:MAG: hypothetical protein ACOH2D_06240 [Gelidibacter sp.]
MKNIYLLISLFLLVGSCQKEDIHGEINNLSLKDRFNPDHFMDVVPYTFTVDWNGGNEVSLYGFDSIAVEYPIIYTAALTPETLNIKSDLSFKLMVIANKEAPEFYINKYVNLDKSDSDDLSQFTGNIQTFGDHGETLASRWYDKGIFLSDLKNPSATRDSDLSQNKMPLERSYIIVIVNFYTDWYKEDGGGGWRYTHTTNNGYTEEVIWNQDDYYLYEFWDRSGNVDKSGGGGNGPYGSTYTGIVSREEATIKKIEDRRGYEIKNELTGKANCAYDHLLQSGVRNPHNLITDLFIEFGNGNIDGNDLTFLMSTDLPINVGGKTELDSDGNFQILINANLMNTLSSIEVAAILVHEISHAFLGKQYNNSYLSFKDLYNHYINDKGLKNYSHDIMNDQFINRMATVLQNYDNQIFSDFEDYKILASQGVFDLTSSQKSVLNTIKNKARSNDKKCKD